MTYTQLITSFINDIWNEQKFDMLDTYVHQDFVDKSLPPTFPTNQAGTKIWIEATSKAFEHNTVIDELLIQDNKAIAKITMNLHHIGDFKGIVATGKKVSIQGYRYFELQDDKIISHEALLDGVKLETFLKQ